MKGLVITLLIMGLLYLFVLRKQVTQMDALSATTVEVDTTSAQPLKPYQQQLDQAKGVEELLNKGVQDRMRSVDGLD